jgi:hypothetical protein
MKNFVLVIPFLFNFVSIYAMGALDVNIFSNFNNLNLKSETPDLNVYNTSSDAIGVYGYNETIRNHLQNNPTSTSYRIALIAEAIIVEEKSIIITSELGKELHPDIIRIRINNNYLNLVRTTNSRNLDNLGFIILSDVASSNEIQLNERRNPYNIGDRKYILWTICQQRGPTDNLNGVLVGIFQSKMDALNFYRNSQNIRNYIIDWELKN